AKALAGGHEPLEIRYSSIVRDVLEWLLYFNPCDARDYMLDALETAYALAPVDDIAKLRVEKEPPTAKRARYRTEEEHEDWRDAEC
ncbi:hypothetical protein, partial [Salmonella sp. SAL4445]|uniref:hypothetical protein n=1 Tax=Salmonella sp. SAL4445 TaxID=3159900 RepID=UPI003978B9DF